MGRTYTINKKKMVSVTTVLGDYDTGFLMQWAANCAVEYILDSILYGEVDLDTEGWDKARHAYKEISKEAQDIGTEVHDYCEAYINLVLKEDSAVIDLGKLLKGEEVRKGALAFTTWILEAEPEFIASELTVHSDSHKYAGTLDCVCKLDGKLYIVDFKTSKKHYPKNAVQLAAYKVAYEEMTGLSVEGVGVLRLDKVTGEYDWKDYTKVVDRQFRTFFGLLQAWNNFKKRRL